MVEIALQFGVVLGLRVANAQRNSHGSGDTNCRRAPHDHGADGVGNFFVAFAGDVGFFRGQLGLIDEAHARVRPFQSLDHLL